MNEKILKEVKTFFKQYTSHPVTGETEINNDLELSGADADAMLLSFTEKFNLDFENIDFTDYFLPEMLFELPSQACAFVPLR